MKTKFNGILTLLLALVVQISFAQEKTISGTVSDESGGLPGVSVLIKGTKTGTETDFDGKYTIKAKAGDVLVFSYLSMKTVERTVSSSNTINVTMVEDANVLEEVVVTGLGIKREKQALGYAVSKVDEEALQQRAEGDVARVLTGKASGVQIQQQSGVSGSGTSVIIRGMNSFSGSNQPLFIVDGVPFASDTNAQGDFVDGNNGSSRFLDIDPNNIESVSVLKGLAAATLYGTQGRNGVILITTKSGGSGKAGPKKTEITVSNSVFFNEISTLANYQNDYGGGFDQAFGWFFSNWGPSFSKDGPAGWGNQNALNGNGTGRDALLGITPAPAGFVRHPYVTAGAATGIPAVLGQLGIAPDASYAWKPYNSVKDFFRTGVVQSQNINVRSASDDGKISYNVNFGNLHDKGFTPGNSLKRKTLSVGGNAKLSNNFTVAATLNLSQTDFKSPPIAASYGSNVSGNNASIYGNLFYTPRNIDIQGLPYQNPVTGESIYYRQNNSIQHPLWTVNNAGNTQLTNRVFGSANLSYKINDNLNVSYQYGIDVYSENNVNFSQKGGKTGSLVNQSGVYQTWNNTNVINNHNFTINGSYNLTEDVDLNFSVGATSRSDEFNQFGTSSSNQQVFGILRHFNFTTQTPIEFKQERNILGLYGQAEFGYKNNLYLTLSGRKDWVSNLTQANRSIVYPSASVSFIPTKAIEGLKSETLNYLKVRAGYGTSANFPTGYPIATTLSLNTRAFKDDAGVDIVTNATGNRLGNPNLKPERIDELEFGVESRLIDNRMSVDASIYNRTTKDLIVTRPLDPSTGYTSTQTNVGKVSNKGIELDLGYDIFRSDNSDGFNWNASLNFSKSEAIVKDLGLDTDIVVYAGFTNLGNAAIVGKSLGTMIGTAIDRDANGNFKVNAAGSYVIKNGNNIIGDANPDFQMNLSNQLSYKNFSLGFLMHMTKGGDIYAQTVQTLLGRGVVNQSGIDRANSFILPGVNPAGQPNTTQINNSTYYFSNILYGPDEVGVYDATVFRLQEVSLSYKLPKDVLDRTPFGALSITLSGNNLWFYAPNMPENTNFDPNVAGLGVGNGRGFEYLNGPSSRRFGLSVKASF